VVSSSQVVSAASSSSRGGFLLLFPCSSVGCIPLETVLHELLQHESSHGLQLFTNYSIIGLFQGVQSFRNRVFQHGSPTGSQVLPGNLLQCGLLCRWVHRSCQEPATVRTSHQVTASFWVHPPAPVWSPLRAAGGYLLHH